MQHLREEAVLEKYGQKKNNKALISTKMKCYILITVLQQMHLSEHEK